MVVSASLKHDMCCTHCTTAV